MRKWSSVRDSKHLGRPSIGPMTDLPTPPSVNLVNAEARRLGPFEVGPFGFGCWRFTDSSTAGAQAVVEAALDNGMNLVDTADVYGLDYGGAGFGDAEAILGRVLAAAPALRGRMVLATKGGIVPPRPYDSSREYLTAACEASLDRLAVETIDLYQIHRPDLYVHPEDLAATLTGLVESGKVRTVGVSNHTPAQTAALRSYLDIPLVSDQPQFSLLHLDPMRDGTLDAAMAHQTVPLAWSPLGGGALATGEGLSPELSAVLGELAAREGCSTAAIAVAFVLAHPARPVALLGTQNPDRMAELVAAAKVTLDRSDLYQLFQAAEGQPLP